MKTCPACGSLNYDEQAACQMCGTRMGNPTVEESDDDYAGDGLGAESPVVADNWTVERASFWRRFWAYNVDQIVLGMAVTLISLVGGVVDPSGAQAIVLTAILVAVPVAYYVWPYSRSGQTVGKALVGIRVVSIDGSPLNLRKGILRTLGYVPSELAFSLGFLWSTWDPDKQAWHDKLAGTIVVPSSVTPRDVEGTIDPVEARRRERRWQLGLGIPAVAILVAAGVGFVVLMQSAVAEVRRMDPWPAQDASPVVVGEPDLSSLGLTMVRNQDPRTSGECFDGSFAEGAGVVYALGGKEMVEICALRYADAATAEGDFAALASYAQASCGRSSNASWGNTGVQSCEHRMGVDRILWSENWILLISAREGSGIPAAELAERVRDALPAHWNDLRESS